MDKKHETNRSATSADEAEQTIELFAERIDAATPCADTEESTQHAADRIGRAVDAAAERARGKDRERSEERG